MKLGLHLYDKESCNDPLFSPDYCGSGSRRDDAASRERLPGVEGNRRNDEWGLRFMGKGVNQQV